MTVFEMLFVIYLVIGLIVMIYDWKTYQEPIYKRLKFYKMQEDSMVCLYMLSVWILWPIRLFYILFKENN